MEIKIQGYTDHEGSELYNYNLSKRRADNAKEILLKKGVNDSLIQVFYYGESTEKGKTASERRMVRLIIYYHEEDKNPVNVRPNYFMKLPFDVNDDSIADFRADYVVIGNERSSGRKCKLWEIPNENQSLLFYWHRENSSFLENGDTLKIDINKRMWGHADIIKQYKSTYLWGPSRPDLEERDDFYMGFQFILKGESFTGWLYFQIVKKTGELILSDKELKKGFEIIIGEH